MKPLTMVKDYGVWNAGEVAGFPVETADRLIAAKIAIPFKGKELLRPLVDKAEPEPRVTK